MHYFIYLKLNKASFPPPPHLLATPVSCVPGRLFEKPLPHQQSLRQLPAPIPHTLPTGADQQLHLEGLHMLGQLVALGQKGCGEEK